MNRMTQFETLDDGGKVLFEDKVKICQEWDHIQRNPTFSRYTIRKNVLFDNRFKKWYILQLHDLKFVQ